MTKATIVNIKESPYDIYIGRGTPWGNPFRIGIHGTREEVIDKYREWLIGLIAAPCGRRPPSLTWTKRMLRGKILGCHCKPQACHGDVLLPFLETV